MSSCILCSSDLSSYRPYIFKSNIFQKIYKEKYLFKCDKCGLGQINFSKLDINKLSSYYKKDYRLLTGIGNLKDDSSNIYYEARGVALANAIEQYCSGDILRIFEVGAGHGFNLLMAKHKFPKASLYTDEPDESIKHESTINYGDLDDCFYDAIIVSHVLEHLSDPLIKLQTLTKSLRSRGVLVIEVPNENLDEVSYQGCDEPHLTFYNKHTLGLILDKVENTEIADIFTAGGSRKLNRHGGLKSSLRRLMYSIPSIRKILIKKHRATGLDFTSPNDDGVFLRAILIKR